MSKLDIVQRYDNKYEIDTGTLKNSILQELSHYGNSTKSLAEQIRKTGKCAVTQEEATLYTHIMEGKRPGIHTFGGERLFYALLEVKYWYY